MIRDSNLIVDTKIKFGNKMRNKFDITHYLWNLRHLTFNQEQDVHSLFTAIENENIIIPLERGDFSHHAAGEKGCRVFDWKILTTPQIKSFMKVVGNYEKVLVPYIPITRVFASALSEIDNTSVPEPFEFEVYDKFLNVTYLVNDEFLQEWCYGHFSKNNIAKKKVQDCSVSELLFAIKQKLNQEEEIK